MAIFKQNSNSCLCVLKLFSCFRVLLCIFGVYLIEQRNLVFALGYYNSRYAPQIIEYVPLDDELQYSPHSNITVEEAIRNPNKNQTFPSSFLKMKNVNTTGYHRRHKNGYKSQLPIQGSKTHPRLRCKHNQTCFGI